MTAFVVNDGAPDAETLLRLRGAAGLTVYSIEAARIGAARALFGVTVTLDGEVIGIGRIVGDGGYFFDLTDMAVLPAHQGKGVGKAIMARLVEWLKANAPQKSFVSLYAENVRASRLYERYGFHARGLESPGMVWKRDLA